MVEIRLAPTVARSLSALMMLVALTLALAAAPARCAQGFDDMTWLTEDYYPYNFNRDGQMQGVSVDLLQLIWKELGEPKVPIILQPWARAYRTTLETPGTVLFGVARTPARETLCKWAGPIAHVRFVLTAPKASGLHIDTPEDLKGLGVGTIRADVADRLLDPWRSICRVEPVATMTQNLRKLEAGRIDMVAYEEQSMRLLLSREGIAPSTFETLFVLKDIPIHYAFHKATDEALVRRFQQALEKAKHSQEYKNILKKHLH